MPFTRRLIAAAIALACSAPLALAPVALIRLWRKVRPPVPGRPRSEDKVPGAAVNSVLYHTYVAPARWSSLQQGSHSPD